MRIRPALVVSIVWSAAWLPGQTTLSAGPWLGGVTAETATIWARAPSAGALELTLAPAVDATQIQRERAVADPAHDLCVRFDCAGLLPDTRYRYHLERDGKPLCATFEFVTAPVPEGSDSARLVFGSCADLDAGTAATFTAIARQRPDVLVLLGDTPYIDSTDLAVQRRRYREFAAWPPLQALAATTPTYSTWDDHDFGANDIDGRLAGKRESRQAFVEYRANPSHGDGEQGIYTSFRRGPVEVFLLDTRWFAATEPSPFENHAASLLGAEQWRWLFAGLQNSRAPFKVLACGMIWNDATRPGKRDHWGSYPAELDALFAFVVRERIDGVVLIGGDIHRSRVVEHTRDGLRLYECITSPLHDRIIESANVLHDGLAADFGRPHSFLVLEARPASNAEPQRLTARFCDRLDDTFFELVVVPPAPRR